MLVLDDVLSELDDHRATALLAHLPAGQIVMTTATDIPATAHVDRILRRARRCGDGRDGERRAAGELA